MARSNTALPLISAGLQGVLDYLLFRDFREPSASPQPRMRTTTVLVSPSAVDFVCDRITWDYDQPRAGRGVPADGFIFYATQAASQSPQVGGFKLSIAARGFDMIWPAGIARTYGIAAYRNTYQGEKSTAIVSDGSWINVT